MFNDVEAEDIANEEEKKEEEDLSSLLELEAKLKSLITFRTFRTKESFFRNREIPLPDSHNHLTLFDRIFFYTATIVITLAAIILFSKYFRIHEVGVELVWQAYCAEYHTIWKGENLQTFNNIPYAVPPQPTQGNPLLQLLKPEELQLLHKGYLRWQLAIPLRSLETCHLATLPRPCVFAYGRFKCNQSDSMERCLQADLFTNFASLKGDEDCLSLDIMAPKDSKYVKRPVVVSIAGLGHIQDLDDKYFLTPNDSYLAHLDIVFVKVRFRLGVFSVRMDNNDMENLSVQDVSTALQWLRDNVLYFKGDADSVTLLAHGSAVSIAQALMMQQVKQVNRVKLFHRVWLSSGSTRVAHSSTGRVEWMKFLKFAESQSKAMMGSACKPMTEGGGLFGCKDRVDGRFLFQKLAHQMDVFNRQWLDQLTDYRTYEKARVFPYFYLHPNSFLLQPYEAGELLSTIPLVISVMQNEFDGVQKQEQYRGTAMQELQDFVRNRSMSPSWVEKMIHLEDGDAAAALMTLTAYMRVVCPNYRLLTAMKAQNSKHPVYMLINAVKLSRSVLNGPYYPNLIKRLAFHGLDLLTLYGHIFAMLNYDPSQSDAAYSLLLRGQFKEFVTTGVVKDFQSGGVVQIIKNGNDVRTSAVPKDHLVHEVCQFFKSEALGGIN